MTLMRRGFLKYYILKLLGEEVRTGYGLMKAIEEETGFWKPSSGSLYPLLHALEEQGLIAHEGEDDHKVYRLTERGRSALEEARRAKAEVLEGIRRSLTVFARIFGEEGEGEELWLSRAGEGPTHGLEAIPESLRPRMALLRHTLLSLPYSHLSAEEIERLHEILTRTLEELGELMERRDLTP